MYMNLLNAYTFEMTEENLNQYSHFIVKLKCKG